MPLLLLLLIENKSGSYWRTHLENSLQLLFSVAVVAHFLFHLFLSYDYFNGVSYNFYFFFYSSLSLMFHQLLGSTKRERKKLIQIIGESRGVTGCGLV